MQPQIHKFIPVLDECHIRKAYLKGLELYEEFSGRNIIETIKERRLGFDGVGPQVTRQVEAEVMAFCSWLKDVKDIPSKTAHYYSISLKSLLAGLPQGVAVGLLFGIVLDTETKKPDKMT